MARQLRTWGLPVQVAEVRKASKFLAIRRDKTDKNDAKGLADLGRLGRSIGSDVFIKSMDSQDIRTQLSVRHALVQQRVKLDAVARSLVRLYGGDLHTRRPVASQRQAILDQTPLFGTGGVADELARLIEISAIMRSQVVEMDARLREAANANPVCGRFMTVPGIGPITSLSFFSAVDDPYRFKRNQDIGPYLGLTPRLRASGLLSYSGRISRFGNKLTRSHLISAAVSHLHSKTYPSALQSWGLRLSGRIGFPKARVAVARKLAVILLSMWKSGESYDHALREQPSS